MQIQRFHCSERNATLLRGPLAAFLMHFTDSHITDLVREHIAATDQEDAQTLLELQCARVDFNLQPPQSKSGLIKEAANHGNGPEVGRIKPLRVRFHTRC